METSSHQDQSKSASPGLNPPPLLSQAIPAQDSGIPGYLLGMLTLPYSYNNRDGGRERRGGEEIKVEGERGKWQSRREEG